MPLMPCLAQHSAAASILSLSCHIYPVGAVCQTTTDPFVLTVNDMGGQLGLTNNDAYLRKVNAQLQNDLNKCLPPGYNADGAISNLRVERSYNDDRTFQIKGDMGGAAKKNPA